MEHKIRIDRANRVPIHTQIRQQIERMIYDNVLPEGKKLPPTRTLARSLGVNRSTIVAVYDDLIADDLLVAKVGSGTVVAPKQENPNPAAFHAPMNWSEVFTISPRMEVDSLIKDTHAICAQPNIITFAAGVPDPALYPVADFQRIIAHASRTRQNELFDLLPTAGYPPLMDLVARETICEASSITRDEIMITAGSIQGLALISQTFLNPDDLVIVENPTFFGALQGFTAAKARLLFVPTDEQGMRVDILEKLLSRHRPKLIYTIPTFQNPGGFVMSLERRRALLDLAHHYSLPIVEDDPYSRIYFDSPPPPSLKQLDRTNHVIYISTFSKVLFPGLRVGWLLAPKPVVERLTQAKLLQDLHTNTLGQIAIHDYLASGELDTHIKHIRSVYAAKMERMLAALTAHCAPFLEWQRPSGGYYIWCKLKDGLSSRDLVHELFAEKVAILPGGAFYPGSEGYGWMRLNFTFPDELQIDVGIKRLGQALARLKKRVASQINPDLLHAGRPIV